MGIFFIWTPAAQAGEVIRVLIQRDIARLNVSTRDLILRDLKTGRMLFKKRKPSSVIFERKRNRLWAKHPPVSAAAFLLSSRAPIQINGRLYRDKIKIVPGLNGDILAINELSLEDYLPGVMGSEMSSQWPPEALKAQAVAARTYAVFQKRNRAGALFDVDSGVNDQVYGGLKKEDPNARQAVRETEGELLTYGGAPIFAVYHSTCGGRTETTEPLWPGDFPYLKSRECNFCLDSPHFFWSYRMDGGELAKVLGNGFSRKIKEVEIMERTPSGRVALVFIRDEVQARIIPGKDFRRLLGYDALRSTNFTVHKFGDSFLFSGMGWGHAVGLCQWGAKGMAEAGMDYREILSYYYPGAEVRKARK